MNTCTVSWECHWEKQTVLKMLRHHYISSIVNWHIIDFTYTSEAYCTGTVSRHLPLPQEVHLQCILCSSDAAHLGALYFSTRYSCAAFSSLGVWYWVAQLQHISINM